MNRTRSLSGLKRASASAAYDSLPLAAAGVFFGWRPHLVDLLPSRRSLLWGYRPWDVDLRISRGRDRWLVDRALSRVPAGTSFLWPYLDGDVSVWVDMANEIERQTLSGEYDADVSAAVSRFVRPGDRCVDVGANVGVVSLLMAKAVGPSGRVLAIEPGPGYRDRIARNLAANPSLRGRVAVLPVGIGDAPGTLRWTPDPGRPFNAVLLPGYLPPTGATVSVPVETLDVAFGRAGWGRLDFMKVDVEGMEMEVFRGGLGTLARHRPTVLFETMAWTRDHRRGADGVDVFAAIAALLADAGYRTAELTADGTLVERPDPDRWPDNTLAIHGSRWTGGVRTSS